MKKQILKTIGGALLAILMLAVFAQISASAQDNNNALIQSGNEQRLVGSWDVQVTIRDCQTGSPIPIFPTFPVMRTYNQGGTMQDAGGHPSDFLSKPGHGVWRHTTERSYYHSFRSFRFNADGTLAGTTKIVGDVELGRGGGTFTANTMFQVLDTAGNVQFSGCAMETATRYE